MTAKPAPVPIVPKPQAPAHLGEETRAWWESVVGEYDLEEHHRRLLTLASEAWDRASLARAVLAKKGLTYQDRFGSPKARPECAIARDAAICFARMLRELSLDVEPPESRPPGIRWRGAS